jgi:SAM-dependent methyltransferase
VFQYELCARAELSVGIDIHPMAAEVRRRLAEDRTHAALIRADGAALPFRSEVFDAVVLLSALEFLGDPEICLRDCRRVLKAHGRLVCVIPRHLACWDGLFHCLFGRRPEQQLQGGRERARRAIETVLPNAAYKRRPAALAKLAAPYEVVVFGKEEP